MPTVRKLTPEEVEALEHQAAKPAGPRKRVEEEYDDLLRAFDAGDYVVADLEPDEHKLTVRARFRRAAARRGLVPAFLRTRDNTVRFQLVHEGEMHQAEV